MTETRNSRLKGDSLGKPYCLAKKGMPALHARAGDLGAGACAGDKRLSAAECLRVR